MPHKTAHAMLAAAMIFSTGMGGANAQERPPDSTPRPTPTPAPAYKWPLRIKQCSWGGGACGASSSERVGDRCNCLVRSATSVEDHAGKVIWLFVGRRAN